MIQLNEKIQQCERCELSKLEFNIKDLTKGHGKLYGKKYGENTIFFLVGENPSYRRFAGSEYAFGGNDDKGGYGDPFTDLLEEIGMLKYCYITNLVKCSCLYNQKFQSSHVLQCSFWLKEEISIIKPKVFISLGNLVTDELAKLNLDVQFVKIKHPSYYFSYRPMFIEQYRKDLKKLKESYENIMS